MRLLAEEEDLGKLALGVARIITASARVARARKAIGEGEVHPLEQMITDYLRELDRERDAMLAAREAEQRLGRVEVREVGSGEEW
jgi:hypothetical protein